MAWTKPQAPRVAKVSNRSLRATIYHSDIEPYPLRISFEVLAEDGAMESADVEVKGNLSTAKLAAFKEAIDVLHAAALASKGYVET